MTDPEREVWKNKIAVAIVASVELELGGENCQAERAGASKSIRLVLSGLAADLLGFSENEIEEAAMKFAGSPDRVRWVVERAIQGADE